MYRTLFFPFSKKNMHGNFLKMDLPNHMKWTNGITTFQDCTIAQGDKLEFQSWQKRVPEYCTTWTACAVWRRYKLSKFFKFVIQVFKAQALLSAKLWIPPLVFTSVFLHKNLKKWPKNPKYDYFGHICRTGPSGSWNLAKKRLYLTWTHNF